MVVRKTRNAVEMAVTVKKINCGNAKTCINVSQNVFYSSICLFFSCVDVVTIAFVSSVV